MYITVNGSKQNKKHPVAEFGIFIKNHFCPVPGCYKAEKKSRGVRPCQLAVKDMVLCNSHKSSCKKCCIVIEPPSGNKPGDKYRTPSQQGKRKLQERLMQAKKFYPEIYKKLYTGRMAVVLFNTNFNNVVNRMIKGTKDSTELIVHKGDGAKIPKTQKGCQYHNNNDGQPFGSYLFFKLQSLKFNWKPRCQYFRH